MVVLWRCIRNWGVAFLKGYIRRRWIGSSRLKKFRINLSQLFRYYTKTNHWTKKYQPDFVCFEEVIVEIKAIAGLSGIEEAQLINYLKATGLKVGLLINFGAKSLEHKRLVHGF